VTKKIIFSLGAVLPVGVRAAGPGHPRDAGHDQADIHVPQLQDQDVHAGVRAGNPVKIDLLGSRLVLLEKISLGTRIRVQIIFKKLVTNPCKTNADLQPRLKEIFKIFQFFRFS